MAKGKKRTSKSKRPASKKAGATTPPPFLVEPTADEAIADAGKELGIEQSPEPEKHYASKTEFIADHLDLLPKAGVKLAKEKYDLDITPDYFSQTKHRLTTKKKAKKAANGKGRPKASGPVKKRAKPANARSGVELQFKLLLKRIGIDRASEILEAYKVE